jgi:transposase
VVDAKVLSGNMDDKTYNNQTLDEVNELLKKTNTDMNTFFYIADSSLFTEGNLIKANDKKIKFITRAPETTNMAKEFVTKSLKERHLSKSIVFENAQGKQANYYVLDYQSNYKGIPVKLAVCYSCSLEDIKRKTISRQVFKEYKELENTMKKLAPSCWLVTI